jgi:Putative binding domain, N-terminal/Viral BACON domain
MAEVAMRRHFGRIVAVGIISGVAIAALWACAEKSPTQPTPPATCTFSLSQSSLSFGASGGSVSVGVTTAAGCAWTAASDRGWMAIDGGASGTGPGTVTVSVTANANTSERTGTLTIAGQAVAVRQDAASEPCTIAISPASANYSKDAATGTFGVGAPASCSWTAGSSAAWVAVTSGATGRGNGTVGYSIERNTGTDSRTGSIRVGEAVFSVVQQGDTPAPPCDFHVAPVSISACMAVSYELAVSVATQPACGWTAATDTPWITLSGGASRTGPGEIRFRIGDNYDAPRQGVLKLRWDTPTAGQNVSVSQAGCRYAVSATAMNVPADGGTFTFDVYQQSDPLECGGPLQNGCVWSATTHAAWITITTSTPRAGDDRVTFTVSPNSGGMRSAQITVRDKTVNVVQAAR